MRFRHLRPTRGRCSHVERARASHSGDSRAFIDSYGNGLLAPELAAGIVRVKSAKSVGVRAGNWLSARQAQSLLNAPDITTKRGSVTGPSSPFSSAADSDGQRWRRSLSAMSNSVTVAGALWTSLESTGAFAQCQCRTG